MRRIIYFLLAGALLLTGTASSCEKRPNPDGPENGGRINPSTTTLLELCNMKIAEYGNDASIPTSHVFICAHRANTYSSSKKQIPENSVRNIEEAIAQGADMVEIDVRATSDGVLVLMHDEKVDATTNGTGKVAEMTFEQLRALSMKHRKATMPYREDGKEIRVPTLKEALLACKGKIYVNLDVKGTTPEALLSVVRETGMLDQVMIYGFSISAQKECIRWAYENAGKWVAVHPYINKLEDYASYVNDFYGCAKLFQYPYSVFYDGTTERFGYKCHELGLLSYSNSLDYDSEIRTWYTTFYANDIDAPCRVLDQFIASGSDFVQTDVTELAHLYLKAKGLR